MDHTFTKKGYIVYLKSKFNWVVWLVILLNLWLLDQRHTHYTIDYLYWISVDKHIHTEIAIILLCESLIYLQWVLSSKHCQCPTYIPSTNPSAWQKLFTSNTDGSDKGLLFVTIVTLSVQGESEVCVWERLRLRERKCS